MERFPSSASHSDPEAVPPDDIEPVLNGLKERVADIGPDLKGEYELPPQQAEDLSETLKDIGAK